MCAFPEALLIFSQRKIRILLFALVSLPNQLTPHKLFSCTLNLCSDVYFVELDLYWFLTHPNFAYRLWRWKIKSWSSQHWPIQTLSTHTFWTYFHYPGVIHVWLFCQGMPQCTLRYRPDLSSFVNINNYFINQTGTNLDQTPSFPTCSHRKSFGLCL